MRSILTIVNAISLLKCELPAFQEIYCCPQCIDPNVLATRLDLPISISIISKLLLKANWQNVRRFFHSRKSFFFLIHTMLGLTLSALVFVLCSRCVEI